MTISANLTMAITTTAKHEACNMMRLSANALVNGQTTAHALWITARLKELLDPELYATVDGCAIEHMWSTDEWSVRVVRRGRKESFALRCWKPVNKPSLGVDPADLARLILFLQ
jgi:hypothetical protein